MVCFFVRWCLKQAGVQNSITGQASSVKRQGSPHRYFARGTECPISGDIFFKEPGGGSGSQPCYVSEESDSGSHPCDTLNCLRRGSGTGHTGFVLSVNGDNVETIEGNIHISPDNDGIGLCRRNIDELAGFLRIQSKAVSTIQLHGNHSELTTPRQKYEHTFEHAGTTVRDWENGLLPNATFLGVTIIGGVHEELNERLILAENYLRGRYPDLSDAQRARNLNINTISGRRSPGIATGGSRISYHAFGLAIDVNYAGNPFIGRSQTVADIVRRATNLILGENINIREQPPTNLSIEDLRNRYQRASNALVTYFGFRNNENALSEYLSSLPTERVAVWIDIINNNYRNQSGQFSSPVEAWLYIINADYNNEILRQEFGTRDPANGFLDLTEDVVVSLVREGGLLWGGQFREGKDFMHFDWRNGTIKDSHRV